MTRGRFGMARSRLGEQRTGGDTKQVAGIVVVRQEPDGSHRVLALLPGSETTSPDGRASYKFYGTYDIPKGHAKQGEPPLDAALREAGEETGYTLADLDFRWGQEPSTMSKGRKTGTFFVAATDVDPVISRNPENGMLEHGGFKWVTFDEMMGRVGRFWFGDAIAWARDVVEAGDGEITDEAILREYVRNVLAEVPASFSSKNWRKYLLYERKTDILYNKIGEYFLSLLKKPEKYFVTMDIAADRDYEEMTGTGSGYGDNVFYALNAKKSAFNKQEFERYQQMTGDTQIMPTLEIFENAMQKFKIEAWDKKERPAAVADMSTTGTMRVYFKDQPQDVADFLNQTLQYRSTTLRHELGHWLNAIRSGYTEWRTSGKGRTATAQQRDPAAGGGTHYAGSTEEMQARITDVFSRLKNTFTKWDPMWREEYLQSMEENNPRLFLQTVLSDYPDVLYAYKLDAPTKRRLINRILEIFNFFKENRDDYPALKKVEDVEVEVLE